MIAADAKAGAGRVAASSDAARRFGAELGLGTQELHHLIGRGLGLLPEFGGDPRDELEVVLRVPVAGRGFDRPPQLLLGSAEPAEARLRFLFDAAFLEEREARPEVRRS